MNILNGTPLPTLSTPHGEKNGIQNNELEENSPGIEKVNVNAHLKQAEKLKSCCKILSKNPLKNINPINKITGSMVNRIIALNQLSNKYLVFSNSKNGINIGARTQHTPMPTKLTI